MSNDPDNHHRPTEYKPSESDPPEAPAHRVSQVISGEVIAERYRLVRKLGEGGMGVVWVAHSLALGVDVAIKLIRSGLADADLASRMAREAQATAILGHPAIVRVFDHGTTSAGDPFLVMELVDGETLGALLSREGKLPVVEAVKLILPLLDGLRCAHERGIVHRDIKPENILIARDALGRLQPKLLDFGIAKVEHQPNVTRLTQVGDVLGSPEFMSPEQAKGAQDTDARTDVWSVCIVLYELVTGTLPFKLKNYNALMQAILHERPVPTVELGVGDRELWRVIAKGLSKTRERRWASMTELGEALAFWLYDQGVTEDACGNSLKAMWLGGTLSGLSVRPRADSWADQSATGTVDAAARNLPTSRLRLRRMQRRIKELATPPVLGGVLTGLALLVTLLIVALSGGDEPKAAPAVAASAGSAPVVVAAPKTGSTPAARSETPEGLPIVAASALVPASSASAKKRTGRGYRPPAPRPPPTRDYGF